MAERVGASKGEGKVVSLVPDVCVTPIGPVWAPVPYPVIASFEDSAQTSQNVNFCGKPAFIQNQSSVSQVVGDAPGVIGGVMSATTGGKAEPIMGSTTVFVNGCPVVRDGDLFTMNNGNTIGRAVLRPVAGPACGIDEKGHPSADTNPPPEPKTVEQKSYLKKLGAWWKKTMADHNDLRRTGEILKGEAKSIINMVPGTGNMLVQGAQISTAMDLQRSAAISRAFGDAQGAQNAEAAAKTIPVGQKPFPEMEMSNSDQVMGGYVIQGTLAVVSVGELTVAGVGGLASRGAVAESAVAEGVVSESVTNEVTTVKELGTTEKAASSVGHKTEKIIESDSEKLTQETVQAKGKDGVQVQKRQVSQNKLKGDKFATEELERFKQSTTNTEKEITVRTKDGTRTRLDGIGVDNETGKIRIQEYKSSETAPLTKNQKKAFPLLESDGAEVVGEGKGEFTRGVKIPPTKIELIRPEGE